MRRRRVDGCRAERAEILARIDASTGGEILGDFVEMHVRGESAVVVLEANVATAASVGAKLAALDADDRARGNGDDRSAAWTVEIDAAVAATALGAVDAFA